MAGGVIRLSPARSKTLVGRILPISPPIAEALARRRARRDPDNPLVFHRDGITIRRWRTAWRTACQAAGVPTRFLHDCRRTAARNLIRANVPERVAMLLTATRAAPSSTATTLFMSRNCSRPATSWSPIWRSRRRRCQPVGGSTGPAQPRALPRPSALCDAAPRKGAPPRHQLAATGLGCGGGRTLPVCALGIASRPPYGLVVTLGLVARILLDVETVAVLVLVATVGLVVWWAAGRSGGARRAETRLRHICFGNAAQVGAAHRGRTHSDAGDLSRRSRYARSPAV